MKKNRILLAIFALIIVVPLLFNSGASFEGADGQAENVIAELSPNYEPWFEPLWEPPSGEIESLLFTLLAVCGSSTLAFYLGTLKGKKNATN